MTTITQHPASLDPTTLPSGPSRLELEHRELVIRAKWESGSTHLVHLVQNDDLGVILGRGQKDGGCDRVPNNPEDTGLVVVSLGIDGEHDEIHYTANNVDGTIELLTQALEALQYALDAARRVQRA